MLMYHIWFFDEKGEAIETFCRAAVSKEVVLKALEYWLETPMHQYRDENGVRKVSLFTFEVARYERQEGEAQGPTVGESGTLQ